MWVNSRCPSQGLLVFVCSIRERTRLHPLFFSLSPSSFGHFHSKQGNWTAEAGPKALVALVVSAAIKWGSNLESFCSLGNKRRRRGETKFFLSSLWQWHLARWQTWHKVLALNCFIFGQGWSEGGKRASVKKIISSIFKKKSNGPQIKVTSDLKTFFFLTKLIANAKRSRCHFFEIFFLKYSPSNVPSLTERYILPLIEWWVISKLNLGFFACFNHLLNKEIINFQSFLEKRKNFRANEAKRNQFHWWITSLKLFGLMRRGRS